MGGRAPDALPDAASLETFIPVERGRLFVRTVGVGRPIVVVHGGPDFDHSYLLPELDRLRDLGRLVYYDQRGRGRSYSGEDAADITLASEIADLDAVRGWLGSDRIAILGHSWGTLLSLEYALRHPDRVSHLALLNPAPASQAAIRRLQEHFATVRPPEVQARMAALRADPDFRAGDIDVEAEFLRLHFALALARPEQLEETIARFRRWFRPEGIIAARAIENRLYDLTWNREDYDLLPALRDLEIPTLVLTGDREFIPVAIAGEIAEAIPASRLEIVPDCGHFSFLEQPTAVHAAVAGLLGSPAHP